MQTDGIYQGTPSGDPSNPGVSPIWASGSEWVSQQVTYGSDRLTSTFVDLAHNPFSSLSPTNALTSLDGNFAAYLQTDGNFVLCHTTNGVADPSRPYWSAFANGGELTASSAEYRTGR